MTLALLIAAGYLAGSIPTGYWLVRGLRGVDIRRIGSGTIGATNAARAFGGGPARLAVLVAVMAIDAAKGFAPTFVAMEVSGAAAAVATGSAALLGNYRPVFMRFQRGGKMVATGGGVLFGLAPKAAAIGAGIWLLVALITRYSSLASLTVAVLMPVRRGADRIAVGGDRLHDRPRGRDLRPPPGEHRPAPERNRAPAVVPARSVYWSAVGAGQSPAPTQRPAV